MIVTNNATTPGDTEGLGFSERVAADEKQKAYEQSLHRWEQNLITLTQVKIL